MKTKNVSAWASPFVSEEGEAEDERRPALELILERQRDARISLQHWKTISKRYAIGFVIFLGVTMIQGPPARLRDTTFALALLYGSMAISRYMKVVECRIEIGLDPTNFPQ